MKSLMLIIAKLATREQCDQNREQDCHSVELNDGLQINAGQKSSITNSSLGISSKAKIKLIPTPNWEFDPEEIKQIERNQKIEEIAKTEKLTEPELSELSEFTSHNFSDQPVNRLMSSITKLPVIPAIPYKFVPNRRPEMPFGTFGFPAILPLLILLTTALLSSGVQAQSPEIQSPEIQSAIAFVESNTTPINASAVSHKIVAIRDLDVLSGVDKLEHQFNKPVVLVFWANWCIPCRKEVPELNSLNRKFGHKGVGFIGINEDEDKDSAMAFIERYKPRYANVQDREFDFAAGFGVESLPMVLVLGTHGEVIFRGVEPPTSSKLKSLLGS